MSAETFRENYEILQRHAQMLREQDEPNIDDLLAIVTESVQAYKMCQARIDAVEKALAQALEGSGVEAANARPSAENQTVAPLPKINRPPAFRRPNTAAKEADDDIPF
ncbi:exodeoxyribonuclease VII small subunit [Azohydromonas australica]|uniref:exodeoxyribonuclease VII small subunit n=1 Tax=Azohydromonas australica TaxID=364039 RepID=UPI000401A813|nr:exodeoxyribonuclease VII small subunit [Azohydromonas australica]